MTYLLFYDRLDGQQRAAALSAVAMFLFVEAGVLAAISDRHHLVFYVVGGIAAFVFGMNVRTSPNAWLPVAVPWIDQVICVLLVLATIFAGPNSVGSVIPPGWLLPRMDVEAFGTALLFTAASIVVPGINDVHCFRNLPNQGGIRKVEYVPSVAFGHRRWLTAVLGVLLLGAACLMLLTVAKNLVVGSIVVFLFGFVSAFLFEHLYGYRSYIMRCFGSTLFVATALAYLIRTRLEFYFPSLLVTSLLAAWMFMWGLALQQMWRETDQNTLIRPQRLWHSAYLCVLAVGHFVVYVWWIYPLRPIAG